jgi:hypothetical protein
MNNTLNNLIFDWTRYYGEGDKLHPYKVGLPENFLNYGADELGIEWNKVREDHLTWNDKPSKSGIDFVIAQNSISYKTKKRYTDNWFETISTIENGCLNIFQDGKPLWYETNWKFVEGRGENRLRLKSARKVKYNNYGGKQSWGKNLFGLKSLKGIKEVCEEQGLVVKYLHLSLAPTKPYMNAKAVRKERLNAQRGALKFINHKDIRSEMASARHDKMTERLNDPIAMRKKFKKAESVCLDYLNKGSLEQKRKFARVYEQLIDNYQYYKREYENYQESLKGDRRYSYRWSSIGSYVNGLQEHIKNVHRQDEQERLKLKNTHLN